MKRATGLFDQICTWSNLRAAVGKALRGKRHRADARCFTNSLDQNLQALQQQLLTATFQFGVARQFMIYDPKPRVITAPRFEERVAHHAIMNICEPYLDRALITDTFACRRSKGRERCLLRAQALSRRYPYFLKLDIRKYFDSIPHGHLQEIVSRRFKERRLLDLLATILDSFEVSPGRGLPIGSLISQHLANQYLSVFDRYCQQSAKVAGYVRYMDDMIVWSKSSSVLHRQLAEFAGFLAVQLSLELKPGSYINRTSQGISFLGSRVFPSHLTLGRRSRKRYRHRLRVLTGLHAAGRISELELQERLTSLTAFTMAAGTQSWTFRAAELYTENRTG